MRERCEFGKRRKPQGLSLNIKLIGDGFFESDSDSRANGDRATAGSVGRSCQFLFYLK
jgi:hypothetical protein